MAVDVFIEPFDGAAGSIDGTTPTLGAAWNFAAHAFAGSVIHRDGSGSAYNNHASETGSSWVNASTPLPDNATIVVRLGYLTALANQAFNLALYGDPSDVNPFYRLIFLADVASFNFSASDESNVGPTVGSGYSAGSDFWVRATVTHTPRTFKFEQSSNGTDWTLIWSSGNFSGAGVYTDASPLAGPQEFGIWWDRRGASPAAEGVVLRSITVTDNDASGGPSSKPFFFARNVLSRRAG